MELFSSNRNKLFISNNLEQYTLHRNTPTTETPSSSGGSGGSSSSLIKANETINETIVEPTEEITPKEDNEENEITGEVTGENKIEVPEIETKINYKSIIFLISAISVLIVGGIISFIIIKKRKR